MFKMRYRGLVAALLPLLFFVVGCAKPDPLNRQAVTGKVTFGGAPLERGTIEFHPLAKGGTSSGATISNGSFAIPRAKGLPVGNYLVRIYSADENAPAEEMPGESTEIVAKEKIPAEFNSASQKEVSVKDQKENNFDFAIP